MQKIFRNHSRILNLALVLLFASSCSGAPESLPSDSASININAGIEINPPREAYDFTLVDQYSQEVSMSEFRGELVIMYFGFTNCPDECPTTLGIWKHLQNLLGEDADRVNFMMISVDPIRDTPEILKEYMDFFDAGFIGLTGTLAEIEDVAADYSISFKHVRPDGTVFDSSTAGEGESYLVEHTTQTFLVSQAGQVVMTFPYNTSAPDIYADLENYLK